MKRTSKTILIAVLAGSLAAVRASAAESQFAYVVTTDLLPKGAKEVEQWSTWRWQKAGGDYYSWEGRTSLEYGAADNVQVALYANYATTSAFHNGVDGTTTPPEPFSEYRPGPDDHFQAAKFLGLSFEGIWRALSPYTDGLGLALYMEPTIDPEPEHGVFLLESRLILQKNYLDDTLVLGFNAEAEQEFRELPSDPTAAPTSLEAQHHWDLETDIDLNFGASYRFAPSWSAGAEFLNEREFFSLSTHNPSNSAYYVGPTLHYGGEKFFVTVTALEQLPWAQDFASPAPGNVVDGRLYDVDFERYRVRAKAGIYF